MKNFRLTWQLGFALAAVFALFLLAAVFSIRSLDSMEALRVENIRQAQLEQNLIVSYSTLRQVVLSSLRGASAGRAGNTELQNEAVAMGQDQLDTAQRLIDSYFAESDDSDEAIALNHRLQTTFNDYRIHAIVPAIEAAHQGDLEAFTGVALGAGQYNNAFNDAIMAAIDYRQARVAEASAQTERSSARGRAVNVAGLILALLVTVTIFIALRRSVVKPLIRVQGHFERIARGDLSQPIETMGRNEIGRCYTALGKMQNMLQQDVRQVREGARAIYQGAHEIAQGNTELSSRTEQQAASLEETASSMEQMTSTVRQNAGNAAQARALTQSATGVAERGGEEMQQVLGSMEDISSTAGQISSIITMIDGIAFQTNILALNASVEAARAGEHGRGFAVVAGEVRSLATRSAEAASEIKGLIDNVGGKIEAGSKVALDAGKTVQEVVDGIRKVNQLVIEIAAASKEQSDGIEQVNQAVGQMDSVTQQNAALVEQATAAANSLERKAAELAETVERFKLSVVDGRERSHPPALGPPPSAPPTQAKTPTLKSPASDERSATKREPSEDWSEF